MITDLFLQGFKCFVEEGFQLGRLTLLSGLNSSGKSSFLQAIRLLYGQKKLEGLGTGRDIVSDLAKSCRIGCNKGADGRFAVEMRWERQDALPVFTAASDAPFCDAFASLSAARLGSELELPLRQAGEVTSVFQVREGRPHIAGFYIKSQAVSQNKAIRQAVRRVCGM